MSLRILPMETEGLSEKICGETKLLDRVVNITAEIIRLRIIAYPRTNKNFCSILPMEGDNYLYTHFYYLYFTSIQLEVRIFGWFV